MSEILPIPEFLRREPTKENKMTAETPKAAEPFDILNNEVLKALKSDMDDLDNNIKDFQKKKAVINRKYRSELSKLVTKHMSGK